MQARLLPDEDVLGDTRKGLVFFGNLVTDNWSDVKFDAGELALISVNPYVELRDGPGKPAGASNPAT